MIIQKFMGLAYFHNNEKRRDTFVMYKVCINFVLFFYNESDLVDFLTTEDKWNIESIISKKLIAGGNDLCGI